LEKAAAATQNEARNDLYLAASFRLLQQHQYDRAIEVAAKIDDLTRRAMVLEIIGFNQAGELVEKGELEDALKAVRNINAPDVQATVLAKIGKGFLDRGDFQRGLETINQAQSLVSKAEPTIELCAATLSIASAVIKQDPSRAYEVIGSAIQMMNRLKASDELWALMYSSNGSQSLSTSSYSWKPSANGGLKWIKASFPRTAGLGEVLSKAAKLDFDESLFLSKQIKSKGLLLAAQAVICRNVIEATRSKKGKSQAMTVTR
jgi:tetratricopeptide (TPR) repeat protein